MTTILALQRLPAIGEAFCEFSATSCISAPSYVSHASNVDTNYLLALAH